MKCIFATGTIIYEIICWIAISNNLLYKEDFAWMKKTNLVEVKLRLTLYCISMKKRNQVMYNEKA